jgi:hypothetical protein
LRFNFDAVDLPSFPVTEMALPCYPAHVSTDELDAIIAPFMKALLAIPNREHRAIGHRSGWLASPPTIAHTGTPEGQAHVYAMFIGWKSKEAHLAATQDETFLEAIKPMNPFLLEFAEGLEMMHFVFKE